MTKMGKELARKLGTYGTEDKENGGGEGFKSEIIFNILSRAGHPQSSTASLW